MKDVTCDMKTKATCHIGALHANTLGMLAVQASLKVSTTGLGSALVPDFQLSGGWNPDASRTFRNLCIYADDL